jgi:hypothetical protein
VSLHRQFFLPSNCQVEDTSISSFVLFFDNARRYKDVFCSEALAVTYFSLKWVELHAGSSSKIYSKEGTEFTHYIVEFFGH